MVPNKRGLAMDILPIITCTTSCESLSKAGSHSNRSTESIAARLVRSNVQSSSTPSLKRGPLKSVLEKRQPFWISEKYHFCSTS